MDDDREDMGEDDAARAFAQLGREVSLLRSAIEGLTAARESFPAFRRYLRAKARVALFDGIMASLAPWSEKLGIAMPESL